MEGKWSKKGKEAVQSSKPSPTCEYDVFLSSEERHNFLGLSFACVLCRKLKDEGLLVYTYSEYIHRNPMDVIEQSKVSIPIFSVDYASSESCLDEVVKIYDCWSTMGQRVLPIFIYVEPSYVRNQTGPFEKYFRQYQKNGVDLQVISKWKEALSEVGSLEGYTVNTFTGEFELVKKIVARVRNLLGIRQGEIDIQIPKVKMEKNWSKHGKEAIQSSCPYNPISTAEILYYDVLLNSAERYSFSGQSLASVLYRKLKDAGLRVHPDPGNSPASEDFYWTTMEAIAKSRVSIPIFSADYASSKNCLDAVAQLYHCQNTMGKIVLPIFLYVHPFEVRNQTGPFEDYFRRYLEEGVDMQVISKWKLALRGIGLLAGFVIRNYKTSNVSEFELAKNIVEKVIFLLKKNKHVNRNVIHKNKHEVPAAMGVKVHAKAKVKLEVPVDVEIEQHLQAVVESPKVKMEEKWSNKEKEVMQSSYPSSHVSTAERSKYNVYLSYEGNFNSLGHSFANVLYWKLKDAGMQVYLDLETFQASEVVYWNAMEAIEKSMVSLPIFSQGYASSEACLHKAVKMFDCRGTRGQLILPIFCGIEPSDIRNQTGPFEEYFCQYQKKGIDLQIINKWKEALREIVSSKGYNLDEFKDENELVRKVVEQVKKQYKVTIDDNLVGMEQHVQAVVEMLQISSWDVQIVGICGMSGIGKTTLAKALYRRLLPEFEHCCFISSIRETLEKKGLHFLQFKLIEELLCMNYTDFRSFEDNLKFIKDRFTATRVLIVLDDVEHLDHIRAFGVDLQCFGPKSRIILTTRKPKLLVEAQVPHRYFVEELDEPHALKLFCGHAFGEDSPEGEYSHLSAEIASSTRGIPLVIKLVGSYLSQYRNNEKEKWEEVLLQLRNCQYGPLQELLMLSHDNLSRGQWHFCYDKAYVLTGQSEDIADYDVVLSFDAQDKVKNLVEGLHKRMESFGIGIFALNGDSMQINDAGKVCIPVFSKSYASNLSCLEMLAHMVECKRSFTTNHILPIFCTIEPFDVGLQIPLSEDCLPEEDSDANRWKEALMEVANISGWSLAGTYTEEEIHNLLDSVCQMVLHKLKLKQLSMGNHLVGINHNVERILELLNLEVNDVRLVAISGEDGAGKTTLAEVVYHQLSSNFEGCSFLTGIDERTWHDDGIKYLQAQMISNLLNIKCPVFQSVIQGINLIKERFQNMKVLIVLDDVTESSHMEALVGQLNWFGPGSRIIIATKFTSIVSLPHLCHEILPNWGGAFDKSYELFSKHTFRKDDPLPNFKSLSEEIVCLLSGFAYPLISIEIVGSLLYGKGVAEWVSLLQNLQNMKRDHEQILRISYERLNDKQKQVFLDISCVPNGIDKQIASFLWYDSQHSPAFYDMEVPFLLSLVKVDANNEIWMHRVVREFGRGIVDQESKRSKRKRENELGLELPASGFERLANIRFFKLDHLITNESIYSMRLRDIIWQQCLPDLQATLCSQCLRILDMSWSKITENWEGWHRIEVPQLRVLNLTGCSDLMLTPAFSFCPNLEMLILEHCSRLVKIDPSIGKLHRLTTLNLRYCIELSMLPKEVGCLTALKELSLDGTSLREIPVSIGYLKNLHILTAINCFSLSHLPSSTCSLGSITEVRLDCTKITELPYCIGRMKLQRLSLRGCRGIKRLSSLVGEVESSLVELDVSKTSISELPKSIIELKALKVLKMDFCFISEFPSGFGGLKKLEEIHASWCRDLEILPSDIGELESLRILKVGQSCISKLPKLPSGLTRLHVESKELKELPDFANLDMLEEFALVNGDIPDVLMAISAGKNDPFHWLERSKFLRNLELCLSNIETLPGIPSRLRKLSLRCINLKHIPPLPSELVILSIQDCRSLKEMPQVTDANKLEEIEILRCPEIKKIEGLEKLQALIILTISSCGIVSLSGLDRLTFLKKMTLRDCGYLSEFPDISTLKGIDVKHNL